MSSFGEGSSDNSGERPPKKSRTEGDSDAVERSSIADDRAQSSREESSSSQDFEVSLERRNFFDLPSGVKRMFLRPFLDRADRMNVGKVDYLFRCMGHTGFVKSVAFSPCGKWIASGSGDNTMKIWNRETGECVKTFEGHRCFVCSVTFSPDGKWIVSGGNGGEMTLFNAKTLKRMMKS